MNRITLLLLLTVSGPTPAELIFKSGFENTGLVSGTATGLVATGLELQLTVNGITETLAIDVNGNFVFFINVAVGQNWSVGVIGLPNNPIQQSCTITNSSGTMPISGADNLIVNCNNQPWNWSEMNWDEGGWN